MKKQKNIIEQMELAKSDTFGQEERFFFFFDWFCKTESLENKSKALLPRVRKVLKMNETGKRFDPSKVYVIFKNNCPMCGRLYDDFRICDIETQDVLFCVCPAVGYDHMNNEAQVWDHSGNEDHGNEPDVFGTWKDVLDFFARPK